jgi:cation diffusion facilitator CzcD-associated flavoprotein CzcO/acyl dehydratase
MSFQAKNITSRNNYFEDFEVGQVIAHARGKTMTEMDNVLLTNLVMNTADGHFNEHRMQTAKRGIAGFDTRVVFGGINFSLVIGLAAQDTGEQVLREIGMDKIRLKTPVNHGDTLYAFSEVLSKADTDDKESGIIVFKHFGINQHDKLVLEGERTVLMKRRPESKEEIAEIAGGLEFDPASLKAKYVEEREKRVVGEGNGQYVPTDGVFSDFGKDPWVEPGFVRPPIIDHTDIIIAGGGFGGLLAGARLHEAGFSDVRVIEDGGDFGGTWYWNRYPGAMCDIEAHVYLPLIEELNYTPKHRYSYAPEMLDLSRKVGQHYDLYRKACFQTSITSARWVENEKKWFIETNRQDRMTANYLVLACGRQSLPKLPGIPGIHKFKGHAFHSSRWDYKYTGGDFYGDLTGLSDKRVAVIGTGATAVQLVPEVAKWAKELLVFQRTPTSVGVRDNRETGRDYADMSSPGWQRARRYNFQSVISGIPQDKDDVRDGWTALTRAITPPSKNEIAARFGREATAEEVKLLAEIFDYRVMNTLRARVDEIVEDPATAETLKPWYRWFCKRPGFHDDYLPTFNRPNVRLVDTNGRGVEKVTESGIVVNGKEYEADCLIFATGFESGITYTRLTGFEIYGRDGLPLSEHWREGVRTMHGMTTDKFPNLLLVGGNQQSAAAVNAVHLLDEQAAHLTYIISSARDRHISCFEPSSEAVDNYVQVIKSSPANSALVDFYLDCTPGYYNAEGKAKRGEEIFFGGRYGDGPIPFFRMLENWRASGDLAGLVLDKKSTPTTAPRNFISSIIS